MERFFLLKLKGEGHNDLDFNKISRDILRFINSLGLSGEVEIAPKKNFSIHNLSLNNISIFSPRIQKILNFVHNNYFNKITLENASQIICLSKYYFDRLFSSTIGIPFQKYLNIYRLLKATEILRSKSDISVTDACFNVGFNDLSNFTKQFKKTFGCSPKKFMNCCIDPNKCLLRKKSLLFKLSQSNNKLNKALDFAIVDEFYIERQ